MPARKLRAIFVCTCTLFVPALRGQSTPPEVMPPPTRPVQLPLSGRTSQPGSAATVQTPQPGGGAQSVNTINSTVQVQGAYQKRYFRESG